MVFEAFGTTLLSIRGFLALQKDYIWRANGVQLEDKWSTVGVQKDYIFF